MQKQRRKKKKKDNFRDLRKKKHDKRKKKRANNRSQNAEKVANTSRTAAYITTKRKKNKTPSVARAGHLTKRARPEATTPAPTSTSPAPRTTSVDNGLNGIRWILTDTQRKRRESTYTSELDVEHNSESAHPTTGESEDEYFEAAHHHTHNRSPLRGKEGMVTRSVAKRACIGPSSSLSLHVSSSPSARQEGESNESVSTWQAGEPRGGAALLLPQDVRATELAEWLGSE